MNILEVKNLEVILKKNNKKIIKNINFSIEKNSCVGILGESGSGKSITCKSILNILNDNFKINGEIIFDGKNLINYTEKEMKNTDYNEETLEIETKKVNGKWKLEFDFNTFIDETIKYIENSSNNTDFNE